MKLIQSGKYQGKIIDYGIGETRGGSPQVMILFEMLDQEMDRHELTWYGTLKEGKGQEITLKALLTCGMKGNDLDALADGVLSNILDVDTPVSLTVEREPRLDAMGNSTGETVAKIKWINRAGGAAFQSKLSRDEAKSKISSLNLKNALAAARHETGIKDVPRKQEQKNEPNFDDLPF
jgi:hypothetical protein